MRARAERGSDRPDDARRPPSVEGDDILNQRAAASLLHSIADALVIKADDLALVTDPDGMVPLADHHGLGLYHHDCRYLNGYELRLGDRRPETLLATTVSGYEASLGMTNPTLGERDDRPIRETTIAISWRRVLSAEDDALHEVIGLRNHGEYDVTVPVTLAFRAGFEDIFVVRGMAHESPGERHPPRWKGDALVFRYDGADGLRRTTTVHVSPAPNRRGPGDLGVDVSLAPGEERTIQVTTVLTESTGPAGPEAFTPPRTGVDAICAARESDFHAWFARHARIRSDHLVLNEAIGRAFNDLGVLRSRVEGLEFFAAGVPWFITLFGRDGLISALQMLSYGRDIAADTLRLLARLQAVESNDRRDARPGKVLHELRTGELARLDRLPVRRYHGTVDATVLFIILTARHAAWTGDLSLFEELRPSVERALEWIERWGDSNDDGYLDYRPRRPSGLYNHGWKDSSDAIVLADGRIAGHPITLCEVQGYAYLAQRSIARLFRLVGEPERAEALCARAERLRERFNRDFWMDDRRFYALALHGEDNRPARVISSNAGQALWTGIVDSGRARDVAERLMADDMFSGWGVRTLSAKEKRYNPIGYHLGAVWPHDNAFIVAGLRRYGFDDAALRIFSGILDAVRHFDDRQLPELFAGFPREGTEPPVYYPIACHPQAWSAGSIPYMLETLLGLEPDAFDRRLRVVRPILPEEIGRVDLRDIRVGDARADLRFVRTPDGVDLEVLDVDGELEVRIDRRPYGAEATTEWP